MKTKIRIKGRLTELHTDERQGDARTDTQCDCYCMTLCGYFMSPSLISFFFSPLMSYFYGRWVGNVLFYFDGCMVTLNTTARDSHVSLTHNTLPLKRIRGRMEEEEEEKKMMMMMTKTTTKKKSS